WLHDMQNADGGWPAFVWGLPAQRPSRPLFATPIDLPPGSYLKAMRALIWPIPELEDPSTEDLTARVLHGLGSTGARTDDPMVARGLAFLRDHQSEAGGWWGRWVCNYLASTAYVLGALARVGEDLDEAYVKRAIEWTLSCQNADGGWGESTESYLDPEKAGRGPSTAPLTALVVQGLVECGEGERVEVEKAIAYLIAKQRPDGTWPNDDYVATNIPPQGFYVYDGAARHMPLEALARYARRQELLPEAPLETGAGRFTSALLEPMRRVTDPLADDVVHAIYGDHDIGKVNALLASILDNDDPVPPGLPKEAQAFFDTTTALPAWHDPKKTARAQAIFDEFGVYVTFGLFCSSLPQAYCASHGAVVLIQTGALLDRVRQRIFETAQFLFDVMDEDSLGPNGRAIRSAQRVRLMHAAVRCLIRHHHGARWDVAKLGEPINQEDLAGTLMTFSVVTYDAARRLGVALSPADADAWIHHWCVIGHVLGIREELLPKGLGEAQQLMDAIRQRQWTPSPQSRELARALVDMMQEFFTQDARALDGLTPTLIRYLAGDHCADLLGLPPSDWTELMVTALRDATDLIDIDDREGWLERQLGRVTGTSMRWIADVERGSKRASFRIPASLRATVVPGT
ncbi:MAG: oxygenase MpaB family protein, partial [Sandaracinaceae bacterium]